MHLLSTGQASIRVPSTSMIVCVGCGGRNEPSADSCVFCQRRLTTGGRGRTGTATLSTESDAAAGSSRSLPGGGVLGLLLILGVLVVLVVLVVAVVVLALPRLSTLSGAV
jgi:hypothetical protein